METFQKNFKSFLLLRHNNRKRMEEVKKLTSQEYETRKASVEMKLEKVEETLKSIILHGRTKVTDRHEMKIWLIQTIASFEADTDTKIRKFIQAIEGNRRSPFVKQLILFACQKIPHELGSLFANKPSYFRDYFARNPHMLPKYFTFQFSGKNERGALALEQYIFAHRDAVWDSLHWSGRRAVPPPVAIQKKNLLMELDVVKTLLALENPFPARLIPKDCGEEEEEEREEGRVSESRMTEPVKSFWESDYFKECIETGDFIALDYEAFAEEVMNMLSSENKDEREDVLDKLETYLEQEEYKELCQKTLFLLEDSELLLFVYNLISSRARRLSLIQRINAVVVCECKWNSVDSLLLFNAITNKGKQLVRFLVDQTFEKERETLKEWLSKNFPRKTDEECISDELSHWVFRDYVSKKPPEQQWRFALLEGFLILYRLLHFYGSKELLEDIMKNEGIEYQEVTMSTYYDEKKHHSKKRKRQENGKKEEFVGWKFIETVHGKQVKTETYNLQDASMYLFYRYLADWI